MKRAEIERDGLARADRLMEAVQAAVRREFAADELHTVVLVIDTPVDIAIMGSRAPRDIAFTLVQGFAQTASQLTREELEKIMELVSVQLRSLMARKSDG